MILVQAARACNHQFPARQHTMLAVAGVEAVPQEVLAEQVVAAAVEQTIKLALLAQQIQEAAVVVLATQILVEQISLGMVVPASSSFVMPTQMMMRFLLEAPQPSRIPAAIAFTNGPALVRSHSKGHQWHTLHS